MATDYKIDRPVKGNVERSHRADVPQASPAEFLAAIDAMLAFDGVVAVGWTQYTPYFNDGETCEFSVHEVAIKLDPEIFGEVPEDEEAYDMPDGEGFVTSYGLKAMLDPDLPYPRKYDDSNYAYSINGVDTEYLKDVFKLWKGATFESVALENFGDHATVIATPEGFSVEFNEHE